MSDWDFLHDMGNEGYSPDQIAEAAACGYNPYESFDLKEYGLEPEEWETFQDGESFDEESWCDPAVVAIFEDLFRMDVNMGRACMIQCSIRACLPSLLHLRFKLCHRTEH